MQQGIWGGGVGGKRSFASFLEEWIGLMPQVLLGYELRMFLSSVAKKDHQWFKMQDSEHGNVAQKSLKIEVRLVSGLMCFHFSGVLFVCLCLRDPFAFTEMFSNLTPITQYPNCL